MGGFQTSWQLFLSAPVSKTVRAIKAHSNILLKYKMAQRNYELVPTEAPLSHNDVNWWERYSVQWHRDLIALSARLHVKPGFDERSSTVMLQSALLHVLR